MKQLTILCTTIQYSQEHCMMVIGTVAEWTKKIQKKENFRMEFVQLPSIQNDYSLIDVLIHSNPFLVP